MPSDRRLFHSQNRTHPSLSLDGQNSSTSSVIINTCKFICMVCLLTCCFFLFIIGLIAFRISLVNGQYGRDASSLIAFILLAIPIVSCVRLCRTLKRYSSILNTRRQHTQRSHEQQQVHNLLLSSNNNENPGVTDLPPSYKELFPSQLDINNNGNTPSQTLPPPPSYDDFVKRLVIHHQTITPSRSSLSFLSRYIWITDQTQRPVDIPGTVTYL